MWNPVLWIRRKVSIRLPTLGEPVWWASKQVGCTVTWIGWNDKHKDRVVIFQGGEIIKNKRGRQVPRWTVKTLALNMEWRADIDMWVFGAGQTPKRIRDVVVYPTPVSLSGQKQGSFAIGGISG